MANFPHTPNRRHARSDGNPVKKGKEEGESTPEKMMADKRMRRVKSHREQNRAGRTYGPTGGVVAPGAFKV